MISKNIFGIFILLLFLSIKNLFCEEVYVETNAGTINGLRNPDGDYFMFLGIPYAVVDRENPFATSSPHPGFEDVFNAYNDTAVCPQLDENNNVIEGTIDCLRLNVFVPGSVNTSVSNLPVMIWIYGGRFEHGSAKREIFGPSYLVQHEVIVVTFNYRTGPYGFMCLDIPTVSGNQGLKDQYLAFKWVKDNIQAFGGDPSEITLFGQSAGGHSIDFHLMSPKKVLYNKVILQSGSAQSLTVFAEPDKSAPLKMARYTGFQTNETTQALLYLSQINTKLIIIAANKLKIQFRPCVETLFDGHKAFISGPWINAKVPKVRNISVLMGFNKLELAYSLFPKDDDYFYRLPIVQDNMKVVFDYSEQEIVETQDYVSRFYFGDREICNKLKFDVIRFDSDFTYIHPVHRTLQKYIENGAGDIYFYMFSYVGGRNAIVTNDYDEEDVCCASHGDELGYLFDMRHKPDLTYVDQKIRDYMTVMWTNFAKYGNPTPEVSDLIPVTWRPLNSKTYYYMNIDVDLTMRKRPLHERMSFWDLFYRHNKKYQKGYEEE